MSSNLLLIPLFFFFSAVQASAGETAPAPHRVGGLCEYRSYKGVTTITSVTKVGERADPPENWYEVRFSFRPEEKIEESFARVDGKEFILEFGNSNSFGLTFLNRNQIQTGATIDCILRVIIRGTCTPFRFEFPTLRSEAK